MKYFCFIILALLFSCKKSSDTKPTSLSVERKIDPIGVEAKNPQFGWVIQTEERGYEQSAWQIQVASNREKLHEGAADVWDSEKVQSSGQHFIDYQGEELQSAQPYFWRVKIWSADGRESAWSDPASFTTALLDSREWNKVKWIAFEKLDENQKIMPGVHLNGDHLGERGVKRATIPLFRKTFEVNGDKTVEQALLFASGLGQYEAHLNGKKVGDEFLAPGWTNYEERALYNTYDITEQVKTGENALGALVGTGFMYINRERYRKMVRAEAFPMLRMKLLLRYTDGTVEEVITDQTWKTSPSAITFSTIYGGEDYDATKEQTGWDEPDFDDASWQDVVLVEGPGGRMHAQQDYPLKVMQTFDSQEKKEVGTNKFLYDFGQNASGIIRLQVKGNKGDKIKITPTEVLDDDGMPYQNASGGPYYFEYTLKGTDQETWEPRFTYYGFRYALVEIDGEAPRDVEQSLKIQLLHTRNSSPTVGSFKSSNALLNQVNELINWGIKSNLASVATDCPHREKLGWLEQTHLIGSSLKYNFDIYKLYNKIIDDMIEGQLPNGLVPDIVPEYVPFEGGFRDSPEWGSASIIIPWYLYQWYGDKSILEKAYPMMKRYLDYLGTKADGRILSHGLGDWFDLGPENPGVSQLTPIALTATATYFYDAHLMAKIAETLGETADLVDYQQLSANIKIAFNDKFFEKETGVYATGSQTAYAMPLYMGIVDSSDREKVANNLIDSIKAGNNALTAGDVGYRYLLRALEDAGASQLIYEMNNRDDVPGYGYQIKHGATALTESWPALKYVSNNHMMLGHLMEWLYSGLGGIRQQEGDVGFKNILIEPEIVEGLDWVETGYHSINGEIKVRWTKEEGGLSLDIEIPANTQAQLLLPAATVEQITENGEALRSNPYISTATHEKAGKIGLDIGSGSYSFTIAKQ
ncbi:family 78 glycoside hydrolase catalytic domain [Olivibacter sp. SDN3]|uniref:alpha-L-rhamnosidase n=1 Tax=Olivibacter sp. SDN3 TaxID=2764720 RepID=UPI0016519E70|nr:alpha-L-rhamnosidase [Olivibacter sp. SDN3]QNL50476.1 family 78 glycoside hydrolase catalytic domain [Olivibacter sp. SDN3]